MLHKIIHTNLCLLKEKGHKISFEEGMFRHRNQPGFEKVGYGLLLVIDPIECKKTIPWPLLNDKIVKNEFRINFVKFIKMINKKYHSTKIPEITASNLQHPGGENFVQFMFKLSSFAVKLEIERMMGAEQLNKVCPQPKHSYPMTTKDGAIMLKIMHGVQLVMDQSSQQLLSFETASTSKLQQLKAIKKHLVTKVVAVQKELENEIEPLKLVEENIKKRLQNIEDGDILSEWNTETEKRIKILENSSNDLCRIRDLSAKSCQLTKAMEKTRTDTLCMDGFQLLLPPLIDELAGSPVMNTRGQVRLEVLLKAGAAAAHKLAPFSQPTSDLPILPLARNLLTDFRQQGSTATEISQLLLSHCTESKEDIEKHIPIISTNMETKEFPNHLKYLDDSSPLQFICEDSLAKMSSPLLKKNRISLNSMASLYSEKGRKVVCSIRRRRSVSKYSFEQTPKQSLPLTGYQGAKTSDLLRFGFRIPSTGVSQKARVMTTRPKTRQSMASSTMTTTGKYNLKANPFRTPGSNRNKDEIPKAIPACKRSIYGKLPSGLRIQANEDFAELPMDDPLSDLVSGNSFSESSVANESQECFEPVSNTSNMEESVTDVPPKKPRKSILDLVERYNKLKTTMKPKTQNNEI